MSTVFSSLLLFSSVMAHVSKLVSVEIVKTDRDTETDCDYLSPDITQMSLNEKPDAVMDLRRPHLPTDNHKNLSMHLYTYGQEQLQ